MAAPGDPIERAHLKDDRGFSPPVVRFDASRAVRGLVRRFWVPVWSLEPGRVTVQRVLQYPVCQLVVADDYAHLVGPRVGLSTKELSGSGWAFGAMLEPAAGTLLTGAAMSALVDRDEQLTAVRGLDGERLVAGVRELLAPDPTDRRAQRAAAALVESAVSGWLPLGEEDLLVNRIVAEVEADPHLARVSDLAERVSLSERSLQRLATRRIGLSPKWLIQRRRLHEAAGRLASPDRPPLSVLAAELGYADEAHFVRDFRRVAGVTPRRFAEERRPGGAAYGSR